ncbi:hypothetical protein ABZ869_31135 [Streptomyces sp. NPDC046928]|uniref:hypothetical protein n=1 Tax=Streptomyces sp. NPDC046928 TaxID=3155021 RepID=UPI0033E1783B
MTSVGAQGEPDPDEPTAAVVRDSNPPAAAIARVERYWEDAVPLDVDDSGPVAERTASAAVPAVRDEPGVCPPCRWPGSPARRWSPSWA